MDALPWCGGNVTATVAERLRAHPRWVWAPGMVDAHGARVLSVHGKGAYVALAWGGPKPGSSPVSAVVPVDDMEPPDLDDWGTLGPLLSRLVHNRGGFHFSGWCSATEHVYEEMLGIQESCGDAIGRALLEAYSWDGYTEPPETTSPK